MPNYRRHTTQEGAAILEDSEKAMLRETEPHFEEELERAGQRG